MLALKKDESVLDKLESLPVINFGKSKIIISYNYLRTKKLEYKIYLLNLLV